MDNSEEYFKKKLSPDQYHVMRQKGTERVIVILYQLFSLNSIIKSILFVLALY
jgi:peptide methionine sulfoxide reductase MsrB